jgi:hypothetical protein
MADAATVRAWVYIGGERVGDKSVVSLLGEATIDGWIDGRLVGDDVWR